MRKLDGRRRRLAEKNIGLVYYVMKSMGIRRSRDDYDDLFGAGCEGLCSAALNWDDKIARFSSFACRAVKNSIVRAMKKESAYRSTVVFIDSSDIAASNDSCFDEMEADMLNGEFRRFLRSTLGGITEAAVVCFAQGKTNEQTARELNVCVSCIEKVRKKALAAMKSWLGPEESYGTDKMD